ncbi:MAG: hypothetical protein K2W85_13710 [Phycisphaerales bacterium]|nr:hypothetical protein [Phycisphaerales bacterium]
MNEYQPRDGRVGPDPEVQRLLRVPQIIIMAFAMGVGSFLAMTVLTGPKLQLPPGGFSGPKDQMFLSIAGALVVFAPVAGLLIRASFIRPLRTRAESGDIPTRTELINRFQSMTVLRGALAEGPALLGVVTTFLTGNALGLMVAGVCMLIFAMVFPTYNRYAAFARDAGAHA